MGFLLENSYSMFLYADGPMGGGGGGGGGGRREIS